MIQKVSTLLVIASLFAGASPNAIAQQKKTAPKNPDHKGKVTVHLRYIKALNSTGAPDPAHDKECRAKFGSLIKPPGKPVTTSYNINTETLIMSATSTFEGKDYALDALGLANVYAFGTFRPSPEIYAVLFQISHQFTRPASDVNFNLNAETSCLVSSSPQAVQSYGGSVPTSAPKK